MPTKIEFGMFDWVDRGPKSVAQLYESRLKLIESADRAGFYGYHLAEHHSTSLSMAPSPSVFFAALAQRRYLDRDDVQAIEQVLAKTLGLDFLSQVPIAGGNDAHINFDARTASLALKGLLLNDADHLALGLERHIGDFVEQ